MFRHINKLFHAFAEIVELADVLVAKWSQLLPAGPAEADGASSKKRKSADGHENVSSAEKVAKMRAAGVESPQVAPLPTITSLSDIAVEAVRARPAPVLPPAPVPTIFSIDSPVSPSYVWVPPADDAIVPGEGDVSAFGNAPRGVLVNPVKRIVGGRVWLPGKRGGVKFPKDDVRLRLIRDFLRTDEPIKVGAHVPLLRLAFACPVCARSVCL